MRTIDVIAAVLLVIGGVNWGLVGLAGIDLVAALFGSGTVLARVTYGLVGLAALYQIASYRLMQRRWATA